MQASASVGVANRYKPLVNNVDYLIKYLFTLMLALLIGIHLLLLKFNICISGLFEPLVGNNDIHYYVLMVSLLP